MLLMGPGVPPRVPRVPLALAVPQTEFCNPVFEGEEPRAAPSVEHPPDKDGTGPAPRRDGLGTSLGVCTHPLPMGLQEGGSGDAWGHISTEGTSAGDEPAGLGEGGMA